MLSNLLVEHRRKNMIKSLKKQRTTLIVCLALSMLLHLVYGLEGMKQTQVLKYQIEKQKAQLMDKQEQIKMLEIMLENRELDASEPLATEPEYIGTFTVTHYCLENYPHICNDGDCSYTASGQAPIPYYTVAADSSIPFGTKLLIDGQEYEVMDRGGAITTGKLDIAVATHDEALELGVIKKDVYLIEN